jgi:hypothetical protein
MDEQLMKSLVELIDETIAEVEELKKSERFSASGIKMDGVDGIKMAGQKDANGGMDKSDDDDADDKDGEEEDKDDEDKDDKKPPFMKKGEGKNREADPDGGKFPTFGKADDEDEADEDEDDMEKGEGENRQADPNGGKHLAKSLAHSESLMKSYVEGRLAPIEDQLRNIAGMVEKMFKTPVPARSQGYKNVSPLMKSEDAGEPLTKSQILDALEVLQKSGKVSTQEVIAAELGSPAELAKIANKYQIKN